MKAQFPKNRLNLDVTDNHLANIVKRYADLERRVRRLMQAACSPTCSSCIKICCRPEMCRESLDSPFLVLVRNASKSRAAWEKEQGWLGSRGCRLEIGRPPVCYEFLCQDILDNQPDEIARSQLKALARLLSQAGQRALGGDHIVEIMTMERLARVKPGRMAARFELAETKLAEHESSLAGP